jgi:hypothetical protein
MLQWTKDVIEFSAIIKATIKLWQRGWIKQIYLKVPTLSIATKVVSIAFVDTDGDIYFTLSTGWASDSTTYIDSLNIPMKEEFSVVLTLDQADTTSITLKTFIARWP